MFYGFIAASIIAILFLFTASYYYDKYLFLKQININLNKVNQKFLNQIENQTKIIQKMDGWQQEAVILHAAHIPAPTWSLILKKLGYDNDPSKVIEISLVPVHGIQLTIED